jgi:hypothetical protein
MGVGQGLSRGRGNKEGGWVVRGATGEACGMLPACTNQLASITEWPGNRTGRQQGSRGDGPKAAPPRVAR